MLSEEGTEGFDFKLKTFVTFEQKLPDEKAFERARENMK